MCCYEHGSREYTYQDKANHLATYGSGPLKALLGYWLVRRNQRKFLKDEKSYLVNCVSLSISRRHVILTLKDLFISESCIEIKI